MNKRLLFTIFFGLISFNRLEVYASEPENIEIPIKLTKSTELYNEAENMDSKLTASLSVQSVMANKRQGDWYEIDSYLGKKWIKPNQAIFPIDNVEEITIDQRTPLYQRPKDGALIGANISPQKVSVLQEWNGWIKIKSYLGDKWLKYQPENEDFNARIVLTSVTNLYDNYWKHSETNNTVFPQTVTVTKKRGEYLLIQSWIGNKWIKTSSLLYGELENFNRPIDFKSRKSLYLSPNQEGQSGNSMAPQQVIALKKWNNWVLINSWLGLRWVQLDQLSTPELVVSPPPITPPPAPKVNQIIDFSGYTWKVKTGTKLGPGPNEWSNTTDNVWVDNVGKLHMKITNRNGKWYCPEIVSADTLGYGTYRFYLESRMDLFDPNVVVGLFTYDNSSSDKVEKDYREIDIEFSKWGYEGGLNSQFVVQPFSTEGNRNKFFSTLNGDYSNHNFTWTPGKINFQSLHGHSPTPPSPDHIMNEWSITGNSVPDSKNEKTIMNLWLYQGQPPTDGKEVELVIKKFEFTPYQP